MNTAAHALIYNPSRHSLIPVPESARRRGKCRRQRRSRAEIGTQIGVAGDLGLQAGNDLSARAASVEAGGALSALAGNDLTLAAGDSTLSSERWHKSSKGSSLAKRSSESRDTLDTRTALATTFSGDTVLLQAGHDLTVRGSNAVATGDLAALAGNDLSIEAATQTHAETHYRKEKKSGLSSSGASISVGSQKLTQNAEFDGTSALGSTLGSVEGHVTLLAGEHYRQTGSDVLAPQGDITIAGKAVSIEEAREASHSRFEQKFKQSGLTISISNPVISAIQTVQQMSQAASHTDDGRMKALAAASAGLSGYGAYSAVQAGQGQTVTLPDGTVKENQIVTKTDAQGNPTDSRDATAMDKVGGINLSISLGSSKSQSRLSQKTDSAAGSTVAAGGEVMIVASGAGAGSDLTVQGSRITGQNVTLMAEDEIRLLAAANTSELRSKNKSSSASVGVSIGTGGLAITAAASKGKGKANGDDLVWTNTHVEAAETVTLQSGGDTALKGAVVSGHKVQADIGGNLEIESLQDRSTYDSKQSSAGFSLSVPITGGVPNLAGIGGNVSAGKSKVESDYASVTEQSGIRAGDGGFDVQVGGDTTLTGGAITSTQQAIDTARNRFETGGELTLTDIENKAEYEAKGGSINLGAGVSTDGKLKPQGTSAGFGSDSDDAQSMTLAAISDMAGNKEARTGDAETGIKPIFDADKVQKEIDAQVQITQQFGQQASKAVGDYADTKLREAIALQEIAAHDTDETRASALRAQAEEIIGQWGANGTLRLAAHTLIGGLTGGASGAAGAAVGTLTAPAVADALAQAGIDGPLATAITALASTAAGAAVGGTAGGSTALNEVGNNYLSHGEAEKLGKAKEKLRQCKDKACADAATAEINYWEAEDKKRNAELEKACISITSQACQAEIAKLYAAAASYDGKPDGWDAFGVVARERAEALSKAYQYQIKTSAMPEAIKSIGNLMLDLTPVIGDAKAFAEAETKFEYALAIVGALGPVGDGTKVLIKEAKALYEAGDAVRAAEKIAEAEKTLHAAAGSKGAWDKLINGQLEAKAVYQLDNGHKYITDATGRVKTVEGELSLTKMDRNTYQQCATGKCGEVGDEGGHLIASSLGGAGDKINIVPQASTLNRGDWKAMENELRDALKSGKEVSVKIELGYPVGGGVRPNEFRVLAIVDGKTIPYKFTQ